MNALVKFFTYNNAVPIAITLMLVGGASAFAATNPDAIYSSTQQVVSIDNSYIANRDLSNYSPRVEITGVTEDAANYYVAYNLSTIDLSNGAWQDVVKSLTLTVSKADLGPYRDLGLYVTEQLKQKTERELAYLKEVQGIERKNITPKVVATTYGGLVGKFLDTSTETLPGYTPVVTPPPEPVEMQVASAAGTGGSTGTSGSASTGSSNTTSLKIGLQLLGNNPATIARNVSYIDLGAVLIDPYNTNVGIHVFQDGAEVVTPQIDTSTSSASTIEYRATDPSGATITVRRVVLVGDAVDPGTGVSTAGNVTTVNVPTPTVVTPTPPPTSTATEETTQSTSTADTATDTTAATSSSEVTGETATTTQE